MVNVEIVGNGLVNLRIRRAGKVTRQMCGPEMTVVKLKERVAPEDGPAAPIRIQSDVCANVFAAI